MYKNKIIIHKREVIPPITASIIPVNLCQNNPPTINFTTDEMTFKFELFSKNRINNIYLTEIMRTDWIDMLHE